MNMKLRKFAAVILAAVLMLTLCVTFVHADEDSSAIEDSSAVENSTAIEDSTAIVDNNEDEDTGSSAVNSSANDPSGFTPNWDAIIAGGIVLLALIVVAVIYFVSPSFHEKVNKFFKNHISELKKVVWSPARDVKKNTVIVIVLSLGFALFIGLLDLIFSQGILALGPVIKDLIARLSSAK